MQASFIAFISLKLPYRQEILLFFCNNPIASKILYAAQRFCGKRLRDERNIRQLNSSDNARIHLYLFVRAFHPLAEGARYARNQRKTDTMSKLVIHSDTEVCKKYMAKPELHIIHPLPRPFAGIRRLKTAIANQLITSPRISPISTTITTWARP